MSFEPHDRAPQEFIDAAWRRVYLHSDPCAEFLIDGRWFTAIEILGYPTDYPGGPDDPEDKP